MQRLCRMGGAIYLEILISMMFLVFFLKNAWNKTFSKAFDSGVRKKKMRGSMVPECSQQFRTEKSLRRAKGSFRFKYKVNCGACKFSVAIKNE